VSLRRHLLFFRSFRKWGNFRRPRTYSEKLNWRAINDRRSLMAFTSDKLAAKDYVRATADVHQISVKIPETYWVGTDVAELAQIASQLPARWVLKPNHSCGLVKMMDSTTEPIDWVQLRRETANWTRMSDEYTVRGHWSYGQARRLLIAEERIGTGEHAPDDLKIEANYGEPTFIFWVTGRDRGAMRYSNIKMDGTRLLWGHPSEEPADSPIPLEQLDPAIRNIALEFTRAVAAPFDQLRVDGYAVNGEYWFGELTAYPAAGLGAISSETDAWLSTSWKLPDLKAPDPREAEWRALLEGTPRGTLQT